MTFSIVGRCERTGMFGVAITTSSICVGARCPHVRAGVGAVATQNITDPTYGPRVLDELAGGHDAADALTRAIHGRPHLEYRQIIVVDNAGLTSSYTGERILGTHGVAIGESCVAAGNLLASVEVPPAMTDAFATHAGDHLAERLMRALEAGIAAGGEQGPVHSSALLVAHEHPFALVDLRCDWDDADPIGILRRLWTEYEPQMDAYVIRAVDPASAPSFGVPGDV